MILMKQYFHRLNGGGIDKRDDLVSMPLPRDECVDPVLGELTRRDTRSEPRGVTRRQETITPGYTTKDDFGDDGRYSPS